MAILAVFLAGILISFGSLAFAQGGGENYTLLASKLAYDNITAPNVIELSDLTPNRTVNISTSGKSWLKEKPAETKRALSWETGAGKSHLIPALEIPAFLLLLNGYVRLAYGRNRSDPGPPSKYLKSEYA
jgi:hypothetical protein